MKELIAIQGQLKAPKAQRNTFGNYNYRSCEDILEAVKPLLHAQSCVLNLCDEIVCIGSRYYVKTTASITNSQSVTVSATAYAREDETKKGMDGSQITGTASSYARKYALNGLFCIDDTKDSDTDEREKENDARAKKQKEAAPDPISTAPIAKPEPKRPLLMENLANDEQCTQVMQYVYNAHSLTADPAKFDPLAWLRERREVADDVAVIFKEKYGIYYTERQKK